MFLARLAPLGVLLALDFPFHRLHPELLFHPVKEEGGRDTIADRMDVERKGRDRS